MVKAITKSLLIAKINNKCYYNNICCTIPPLLAIAIIFTLFLSNVASAEDKTFIEEYTYMASDIDSKVSSRAISLEQVKRTLLEHLGTYLISETEVKNYQITKDQITTLAAGIVSAEVIDEKWDGRTYYLKAKITADPQEVVKSIERLRNDKQKSKELEDSKKKAEEAMREVEHLKKELELVKADIRKQADYNVAITDLSAADWFDKGTALYQAGNIRDAIEAYNKAIELDPRYADSYNSRGIAYSNSGKTWQAFNDYNKAIELNPQNAAAYLNRGFAYDLSGNTRLAVTDYNTAIELNPQFAPAYINRGNVFSKTGNTRQAINDYNKAIELNPQIAEAYLNRGLAYDNAGNARQAINDYNKAIELNPQKVEAYYNRGTAYSNAGNNRQAINDYNKAIELDPRFAEAYYNRGRAYYMVGNNRQAINDYNKAIELNPQIKTATTYDNRENLGTELLTVTFQELRRILLAYPCVCTIQHTQYELTGCNYGVGGSPWILT